MYVNDEGIFMFHNANTLTTNQRHLKHSFAEFRDTEKLTWRQRKDREKKAK